MTKHVHNFMPFGEGRATKTAKGKWVYTTVSFACLCGAIKSVKVKTVNGVKIEKILYDKPSDLVRSKEENHG